MLPMRLQVALAVLTTLGGCAKPHAEPAVGADTREHEARVVQVDAQVDAPASDAGDTGDARPFVVVSSTGDGGPRCDIRVLSLSSAEVFRGVPRSAQRDHTMSKLTPATRQRWRSLDHGVSYLRCSYRVEMNGAQYTYDYVAHQGFASDPKLDTGRCGEVDTARDAATSVRSATKDCSDPHAGAYWGFDLRP